MLTDRQRRMLRFLSDPAVCPEGLTIQRADQDAIREALAEIERVSVEYTRQRIALAEEAAERIGKLQDEIKALNERLRRMRITYDQRTREYVEDALRMRKIDRGERTE